jgi:photosystem II stability/assembly factor-like uncharacterized protein
LDLTITALAVNPSQPQIIFAGTDKGELYQSSDGGATWANKKDLLPTDLSYPTSILSIAYDSPAASHLILLLDRFGFYGTSNDGKSWQTYGRPSGESYYSVMARLISFNPQVLIVSDRDNGCWRYASDNPLPAAQATRPVTQSTAIPAPVGIWQQIPDLQLNINGLAINPANPQELYAAFGDSSSGGVYKSTDGGQTWAQASQGLPNNGILAITFDPGSSKSLFASSYYSYIYTSQDGAQTWTKIGQNDKYSCSGCQKSLYISPWDPNLFFFIEEGMAATRSRDGGQNWSRVSY